jgi:hypothetical protein
VPIEVPFKEVASTVQQLRAIASDNFRIAVQAGEQSFWTFTFVAIALQPSLVLDAPKEVCL